MDMSEFVGQHFLKLDDVKASGPTVMTITGITKGLYGKPDIDLDDGTCVLSLNKTNSRTLTKVYGFNSDDWIGKEIELAVGMIPFNGQLEEAIVVKPISPEVEHKAPPSPPPKNDLDDDVPF